MKKYYSYMAFHFIYSHNLSEVTFSEGIVRIEENAFDSCKIDEIVLPKSAKQAFDYLLFLTIKKQENFRWY